MAPQGVQGVRDDAEHRHEVADGFDECLQEGSRNRFPRLRFGLVWDRDAGILFPGCCLASLDASVTTDKSRGT